MLLFPRVIFFWELSYSTILTSCAKPFIGCSHGSASWYDNNRSNDWCVVPHGRAFRYALFFLVRVVPPSSTWAFILLESGASERRLELSLSMDIQCRVRTTTKQIHMSLFIIITSTHERWCHCPFVHLRSESKPDTLNFHRSGEVLYALPTSPRVVIATAC